MIGAYIPPGKCDGIIKIYGQLLDNSGVIVIWNFSLLRELDLLKIYGVQAS
jgi:hypothetical protein